MGLEREIPTLMSLTDSEVVRFWNRVRRGDPGACWPWSGALDQGYGRFHVTASDGRKVLRRAARLAWELTRGPIPAGLTIDHLCRNRACCNPAHLEPVTNKENVLRGIGLTAIHASKTACVNGHEFTPENTLQQRGGRMCAQCRKESARDAESHLPSAALRESRTHGARQRQVTGGRAMIDPPEIPKKEPR